MVFNLFWIEKILIFHHQKNLQISLNIAAIVWLLTQFA